ncbi:YitT family protein [Paenibacillus sp. HJL G12]|uniref:YitT family protein n=2 Tax=Paenibacillus dendrobii TaxID=2691084 RepID=A0A7X3IGS3_9BACL|nr:YitT family protein [Paenibacillus dendrobii]
MPILKRGRRTTILQSVLGGIAASIGLELFLHPHELIAGGVTGISALVSFHTEKEFGVLLLLFNLPLLLLFSFLGHKPVLLKVLPGMLAFSGSAILLAPLPAVSGEPVIAALAGGLCLGIGAGFAVKSGGLLDSLGLERPYEARPPVWLFFRQPISTEQLLLLCHGTVLILAGIAMGWERTLYSALACAAAYETSGLILWGIRRTVWVAASDPDVIRNELRQRLCIEAVSQEREDGKNSMNQYLVYHVHVLDIPRFKAIIKQEDPGAEVIFIDRTTTRPKNS